MRQKQLYAAPATEVLELRLEGVIALSNPSKETPYQDSGDWWTDSE